MSKSVTEPPNFPLELAALEVAKREDGDPPRGGIALKLAALEVAKREDGDPPRDAIAHMPAGQRIGHQLK